MAHTTRKSDETGDGRGEGGGRDGGRKRGGEMRVTVSRSFKRPGTVVVEKSLKESVNDTFDELSMTASEKSAINTRMVEHLEQRIYQFVMLRYVCSATRKPKRIETAADVTKHFLHLDLHPFENHVVDKKEIDACLLHCRDGNTVLETFTRHRVYLLGLEQEFYWTKCTTRATYRAKPVSFLRSWFEPTPQPEDVVDLCLVYNITEAMVERVLTQLRVRREKMLLDLNKRQEPSVADTSSTAAVVSADAHDKGKKQQQKIEPRHVSIAYSAPPCSPLSSSASPPPLRPDNATESDGDDLSSSDSVIINTSGGS